jgi:transposase-like protein
MTSESGKTRRRYGAQFKAMVLAQCDDPGMSVAQVAMSHGINDNVVHRWRQLARQQRSALHGAGDAQPSGERPAGFVPLALPAPDAPPAKVIVANQSWRKLAAARRLRRRTEDSARHWCGDVAGANGGFTSAARSRDARTRVAAACLGRV